MQSTPTNPSLPLDGLTALLNTLTLRGFTLYRGRFAEPWGLSFTPAENQVAVSATFHMVLSGAGSILTTEDGTVVALQPGDFVLLPHSQSHYLTDRSLTAPVPIECAVARGTITADDWLCFGGAGEKTETLCGNFFFTDEMRNTRQPLAHPLLHALPPVIVLRAENGNPVPWLPATLEFLRCETTSNRPGYQSVVNRLAEILFIQAVRVYLMETSPDYPCARYLHALIDNRVAPALLAIHTRPAVAWSVASLAAECCLSRSAFAQVFTERVGVAPLSYLTGWRLFLAGRDLRGEKQLTLAQIAERVGYGSEAALSKVFKQHIGLSPGEYRRQNRMDLPPAREERVGTRRGYPGTMK